jgi:4a-hydroxytetrahydrobiopterin dehydratase
MARPARLDDDEVHERLAGLTGWEIKEGKLHREFLFSDFVHAFRFMTAVALTAERMDHHPEWSNVYNRVAVSLTTHDAGGLTDLDFRLAEAVSSLAGDRRE